jgi:rubrerythrin
MKTPARSVLVCATAVLAIGVAGLGLAAADASVKAATSAPEKPVVADKSVTLANEASAYALEVQNQARFDAYAAKAGEEGYKSVVTLFRALSASQEVLIKKRAGIIKTLGGSVPEAKLSAPVVKSTKENLEAVLAMDLGPKNAAYGDYARQAEAAKVVPAVYSFKGALATEAEYVKACRQALGELDAWKDAGKTFAVCQVCAYLVQGKPPTVCPICSAPQEKFTVIK